MTKKQTLAEIKVQSDKLGKLNELHDAAVKCGAHPRIIDRITGNLEVQLSTLNRLIDSSKVGKDLRKLMNKHAKGSAV